MIGSIISGEELKFDCYWDTESSKPSIVLRVKGDDSKTSIFLTEEQAQKVIRLLECTIQDFYVVKGQKGVE